MTEQEARDKIAGICEEMKQAEIRWKSDPLHWTNNKRRLHGLCALRGVANKKNRFELPEHIKREYNQRLFEITSEAMNAFLKESMNHMFDNLASIKECNYGEETNSCRQTFN